VVACLTVVWKDLTAGSTVVLSGWPLQYICSLGHGLYTITAVPRSTEPSTLCGTVKWISAFGQNNNNNNKWRSSPSSSPSSSSSSSLWSSSLVSSSLDPRNNCSGNGCQILWNQYSFLQQTVKKCRTRMWANAQRDGCPAEYRWRPLFNAAKFGWRPILECRAVTLQRCETRWN